MAKSGLRSEVLWNHNGTDGLQMRDLPDPVIHQGTVKSIKSPGRVIVRRELSKAEHQYYTFLTASATRHIVAYLNDRLAYKEPLHGNSPVIAPDHIHKTNRGGNSKKAFLPTRRIGKQIRGVFRPRFQWRPYVLRSYFDTQLLIAESKGKIAHDFRVFFMGHKGSIEARYTTNKGILSEELVSEMSDAFERSEEYLEQTDVDSVMEHRQTVQKVIEEATPEQLGRVLEILQVSVSQA